MGMGFEEITATPNPTAKIAFRVKGVAKATSPKYYPAPAPQGARKNFRAPTAAATATTPRGETSRRAPAAE